MERNFDYEVGRALFLRSWPDSSNAFSTRTPRSRESSRIKYPDEPRRQEEGEAKHSGAEGEAGARGGRVKRQGGDLLKPERMYYIERFLLHSR